MEMKIVRNSPMPIFIGTLLILAAPLSLALLPVFSPACVLEIRYAEGGKRIFWARIGYRGSFSLEYTHSVQLSRVRDDFQIDRYNCILLVGTTFSDQGAGLPASPYLGGRFSIQNDGCFRMSGMHMTLPEILLRVDRNSNNVFTFGDRRIDLSKTYGDALFVIRTKEYAVFRCWLWRILNVG